MISVSNGNLLIAVMSFNRGRLLSNCIDSIKRNTNGVRVAIFDDNSTEKGTKRYLDRFASAGEVFYSSEYDASERKTGGLHANMNRALDYAKQLDCEYVFFIQDDMQVVRALDDTVLGEYSKIFQTDKGVAQVRCLFMRSPVINSDHSPRSWRPGATSLHYERAGGHLGLLDAGIVCASRLAEKDFRFEPGEAVNSRRGAARGLRTVFAKNPVFAWLPWPPTEFSRLSYPKRVVQSVTDRIFGVGVHPLRDMNDEEVQMLQERPVEQLPYAERFLEPANGSVPWPWCYEHSYAYPIALARFLWAGKWPWGQRLFD